MSQRDPPGDVEPEARPHAWGLRGEERIEDAGSDVVGYARAVVFDLDREEVAERRVRIVIRPPSSTAAIALSMRFVHTWFSSGAWASTSGSERSYSRTICDAALRDLVREDRERALQALVNVDLLLRHLVQVRVLAHGVDELRDACRRMLQLLRDSPRLQARDDPRDELVGRARRDLEQTLQPVLVEPPRRARLRRSHRWNATYSEPRRERCRAVGAIEDVCVLLSLGGGECLGGQRGQTPDLLGAGSVRREAVRAPPGRRCPPTGAPTQLAAPRRPGCSARGQGRPTASRA